MIVFVHPSPLARLRQPQAPAIPLARLRQPQAPAITCDLAQPEAHPDQVLACTKLDHQYKKANH